MNTKFQSYEVVKIVSNKDFLQEIAGSNGTVLGMDKNDLGEWIYSVSVESDSDYVWCIDEVDLKATGKHKKRSDFYAGETVKVLVDSETGEGRLSEED